MTQTVFLYFCVVFGVWAAVLELWLTTLAMTATATVAGITLWQGRNRDPKA